MIANLAPSRYARAGDMGALGVFLIIGRLFQEWVSLEANATGTTFWQAMIISCLLGAAYCLVLAWSVRALRGDVISFVREGCGKPGVILMAIAASTISFDTSFSSMGSWINLSTQDYLASTPMWIVLGIGMLIAVGFALWGLPVIARTARVFLPILFALFLLSYFFLYRRMLVSRIFPIMGYGLPTTLGSAMRMTRMFGDLMLLSFFGAPSERKKGWMISILMGSVVAVSVALLYVLVFSYQMPDAPRSIIQTLLRMADVGTKVPMIQVVTIIIWVFSLLLSCAASLQAITHIWAALFKLEDNRPVLMACAVALAYPFALSTGKLPEFAYLGIPTGIRLGAMALFAAVLATASVRNGRAKALMERDAHG